MPKTYESVPLPLFRQSTGIFSVLCGSMDAVVPISYESVIDSRLTFSSANDGRISGSCRTQWNIARCDTIYV